MVKPENILKKKIENISGGGTCRASLPRVPKSSPRLGQAGSSTLIGRDPSRYWILMGWLILTNESGGPCLGARTLGRPRRCW